MKTRVNSIDVVRGIIMIIMALDHTRDFFHYATFLFDPTDLDKTTPWLFGTRWITHFCAPAFALLSGVSIYINAQKRSHPDMVRYLLTRGLWLVVVDVTILRFAFFFQVYYDLTFLSILWMLGWCMILMSAVLYLPLRATLAIAIVIIAGHDALFTLAPAPGTPGSGIWTILFARGFIPPAFVSTYPIIPWLAIMMAGYCFGSLYREKVSPDTRRKTLLQTGIVAVVLFFALRWINVYGDPNPWDSTRPFPSNVLSFFNASKYPVSLQFTLMTLGPVLIALALLEKASGKWISIASVYGRVPLFYFLAHFFLIHIAALVQRMIATGKGLTEFDFHADKSFGGITPEGGVGLVWTYVAWMGVVVALYPLCKWYDNYKRTHDEVWLSYL